MDPRRFLILALLGLGLSACAVSRDGGPPAAAAPAPLAASVLPDPPDAAAETLRRPSTGTIPEDGPVPYEAVLAAERRGAGLVRDGFGAAAGDAGPATDHAGDAVVGAVRVFAWAPGRVYPVRAAPLRVTTLTLGPGETLISKAAGDTVRWQIGETTSGQGEDLRSHVLIKPLQRGLATNLVLTTSRRVYLLDLASVGADRFNAAVSWDAGALERADPDQPELREEIRVPDPVAAPEGPLDARYRIEPRGRRPRWTPTAVLNDGRRTFIAFPPDLQIDEAPALFVVAPDGESQMVNYRQNSGLFVVDGVFERAELRLGGRRPQVVRIRRIHGAGR